MTALDDLEAYASALREKRALERQMERMSLTGAPSGIHPLRGEPSTNDRTAAAMQGLDGLEYALAGVLAELGEKAQRGEAALAALSFDKARVVMRFAYLMEMTDAQIAREMRIGRTTVWRLRVAAERELQSMETGKSFQKGIQT